MSSIKTELSIKELHLIANALLYVFEEIEDDREFEDRIRSTRWKAEELRNKIITAIHLKP